MVNFTDKLSPDKTMMSAAVGCNFILSRRSPHYSSALGLLRFEEPTSHRKKAMWWEAHNETGNMTKLYCLSFSGLV